MNKLKKSSLSKWTVKKIQNDLRFGRWTIEPIYLHQLTWEENDVIRENTKCVHCSGYLESRNYSYAYDLPYVLPPCVPSVCSVCLSTDQSVLTDGFIVYNKCNFRWCMICEGDEDHHLICGGCIGLFSPEIRSQNKLTYVIPTDNSFVINKLITAAANGDLLYGQWNGTWERYVCDGCHREISDTKSTYAIFLDQHQSQLDTYAFCSECQKKYDIQNEVVRQTVSICLSFIPTDMINLIMDFVRK